jgi:hypothetical protein
MFQYYKESGFRSQRDHGLGAVFLCVEEPRCCGLVVMVPLPSVRCCNGAAVAGYVRASRFELDARAVAGLAAEFRDATLAAWTPGGPDDHRGGVRCGEGG